MSNFEKTINWLNPGVHLFLANSISLLTSLFAFRSIEMEDKTLFTFFAFYLILAGMTLMFVYRNRLGNPKTQQLLQFSFILLGVVLMITGLRGLVRGSYSVAVVFLLVLFLPGLAIFRAGLHFNRMRQE